VFLSQDGQRCYHEAMNGCNNLEAYRQKISGGGDSSTGLLNIDLNREFPDSPKVIITKNSKELQRCIEWVDMSFNANSARLIHAMNEKLLRTNGMHICQSDINSNLKKIWQHLKSSPYLDEYSDLTDLNIQVNNFAVDVNAIVEMNYEAV
jgi:hypothetical protein